MRKNIYSVITGSGRCIPEKIKRNEDFLGNDFYDASITQIDKTNEEIIQKFSEITGIKERRYLEDNQVNSDIGFLAGLAAIKDAGINKEELDYIIVAHNFGDIKINNPQIDTIPSISSKIKNKLAVQNSDTVAYDILFGCPGWIQGIIQSNYYIKSGDAKKVLVIGTDALSRVSDPNDRDGMIYSDGAGAVVIEGRESEQPIGVISHKTKSDALDEAYYMWMGPSYGPKNSGKDLYLKMNGRKVFEYAMKKVPQLVKDTLEKAELPIEEVKKVLIHQANEKMDYGMLQRLFKLYGKKDIPAHIMPMTIAELGNNSVATVPVLYNLLMEGHFEGEKPKSGEHIIFVSVGAGMNINCVVYKFP
ncbi:MAG: 3-oxoacyl-ACP synthase III family protein [Bacteroidales bacterium]